MELCTLTALELGGMIRRGEVSPREAAPAPHEPKAPAHPPQNPKKIYFLSFLPFLS